MCVSSRRTYKRVHNNEFFDGRGHATAWRIESSPRAACTVFIYDDIITHEPKGLYTRHYLYLSRSKPDYRDWRSGYPEY